MSLTVSFADFVSQYDGLGEFTEWVQKFELVTGLQRVDNLQLVLPMFFCL